MMPAVAAFAASDTGRFFAAVGIDLSEHISDPLVAINLRAAQAVVAVREDAEPDFEAKYG
jgi:hypothetical protein